MLGEIAILRRKIKEKKDFRPSSEELLRIFVPFLAALRSILCRILVGLLLA
jgi:hypothetical protein